MRNSGQSVYGAVFIKRDFRYMKQTGLNTRPRSSAEHNKINIIFRHISLIRMVFLENKKEVCVLKTDILTKRHKCILETIVFGNICKL